MPFRLGFSIIRVGMMGANARGSSFSSIGTNINLSSLDWEVSEHFELTGLLRSAVFFYAAGAFFRQ